MGLFDFLFGRRAPLPAADDPATFAEQVEALHAQSRCDHYTFAHHALRTIALSDPLFILSIFAQEDSSLRKRFLTDVLGDVNQHCGDRQPKPSFGADDIVHHCQRIGSRPTLLIEMPQPHAVAEAYFTALVLTTELTDEEPEPDQIEARYFTLEYGITLDEGALDSSPRTVLCEWTAEAEHRNYGDGPPPLLPAFVEAIAKLLAAPNEEPAT